MASLLLINKILFLNVLQSTKSCVNRVPIYDGQSEALGASVEAFNEGWEPHILGVCPSILTHISVHRGTCPYPMGFFVVLPRAVLVTHKIFDNRIYKRVRVTINFFPGFNVDVSHIVILSLNLGLWKDMFLTKMKMIGFDGISICF